ncbi:MAG: DUF433 domain-containing protein [Isosphaeraceae bacterium]|nr:DUF433 domain-containing protein [Isosphaeraceae bacterium]
MHPLIDPGFPVIKGTTITAEHIMAVLGEGFSEEQILSHYTQLTADDIAACRACDAVGMCCDYSHGQEPAFAAFWGLDPDALRGSQ